MRSHLCRTSLSILSSEPSMMAHTHRKLPVFPSLHNHLKPACRTRRIRSLVSCIHATLRLHSGTQGLPQHVYGLRKLQSPSSQVQWPGHVRYSKARNSMLALRNYCFHKLATPGPPNRSFDKRSTLCTVSLLVTSFILNLPATSFVLNRACFCKLVNLHSKTSVHVREHQFAWVGNLTVIVSIQIDTVLRGESH